MWLWGTSEIAALVTVHMGKLMPMIGQDLRQRRGQVQDSGPGALLYSWSLTSPPPSCPTHSEDGTWRGGQKADVEDSDPSPITYNLCDFGQVTVPPWASAVQWKRMGEGIIVWWRLIPDNKHSAQ